MVFRALIILLAVVGSAGLLYDFYVLLYLPGDVTQGGFDLALRYYDVEHFFQPGPFYGVKRFSVYPPASYVMLWPIAGLPPTIEAATLAMAFQYLILIPILVWVAMRIAAPQALSQKLFVAALVVANLGLGVCVRNGQITLHVVLLLFAGFFLTLYKRSLWPVAALAVTLAVVKPTISVPFFLILLTIPLGWWIAFLSGAIYLLLTFAYKPYSGYDGLASFMQWRATLSFQEQFDGYGDLSSVLRAIGRLDWIQEMSGAMLLGFAVFVYFFRRAEPVLLFTVTAVFARIFGYHRVYDDLLVLPLGIVLLRAAFAQPSSPIKWLAALFMLAHLNTQAILFREAHFSLGSNRLRMLVTSAGIIWLLREIWKQRERRA